MLKTVLLTAALIAPNATETTAPAPEESTPVIIQDHETTEETTAPVEEQTTETAPTVEEAPTAAYDPPRKTTAPNKYIPHDINASDITALNAPYFNKKPFQGVTVINCEY